MTCTDMYDVMTSPRPRGAVTTDHLRIRRRPWTSLAFRLGQPSVWTSSPHRGPSRCPHGVFRTYEVFAFTFVLLVHRIFHPCCSTSLHREAPRCHRCSFVLARGCWEGLSLGIPRAPIPAPVHSGPTPRGLAVSLINMRLSVVPHVGFSFPCTLCSPMSRARL